MPLNSSFYNKVEDLRVTFMGTEHVAPLLYSMIRMLRPRSVLEVGLGYTSPFIVEALKDNIVEHQEDEKILSGKIKDESRLGVLNPEFYAADFKPKLYAIDDYSIEGTSAPKVLQAVKELDAESLVEVCVGDFRGHSKSLPTSAFPFDFVWFDCGGRHEYIDFIEEYWPLINPNHGILLLHFTYWNAPMKRQGALERKIIMGSIGNEIKRQQLASGMSAEFEMLSLLEPHKSRQGSVTQVRKLPWNSRCRNVDFQKEVQHIFGESCKPFAKL